MEKRKKNAILCSRSLIKWNHMQGKQFKDPLIQASAFIDHFILPASKTNSVLYPCLSNYVFKWFL